MVGIDEVGRGALAGPLTVGAVVICRESDPPIGLNDSKLLSATQRESLVEPLRQWAAAWSLGSVSACEIDAWGLPIGARRRGDARDQWPDTGADPRTHRRFVQPPASARGRGLGSIFPPPLRYGSLPVTTVVKGDRKCATIAAASVLAKVHRDAIMVSLDHERDDYGWGIE